MAVIIFRFLLCVIIFIHHIKLTSNLTTMCIDVRNHLRQHIECIRVKRQDLVYCSGSPASGFYFVEDGLVGLYQVSEKGKESLLRIYGPGSYFGYRSLFTEQDYPATARAMLNSALIKISVKNFHSLDSLSPTLAHFLMCEVCEELRQAEKRLMQFNEFNAKKRILDTICHVFTVYPEYPWTYREIGEFSGTDTSTVIRYCKTLKLSGLLHQQSRKLLPIDLKNLVEYRKSLLAS